MTVTSPVSPAAVTFNNNIVSYTIDTTGDGSNTGITGSTGMTLNGSQPVTLVGPNTYTGQTLLNPGSTLVISNANSIGSASAAAYLQRRHSAIRPGRDQHRHFRPPRHVCRRRRDDQSGRQ